MALTDKLANIANAIRSKTGGTDPLTLDQMATEIEGISGGGSGDASVAEKNVNFYDYDGTLLHSYTVAEAQALSELPPLPEQPGLICQGWNWTLENIKAHNRAVDIGAIYITDDGTTRIYITLQEGRTSPALGVSPIGTVTIDWGDGTEPYVLTGTSDSTYAFTPVHEYAAPGDYVIRLTVDGKMGFTGSNNKTTILQCTNSSSNNTLNYAYRNAIRKIELGNNVTYIGNGAFGGCASLTSITIPNNITNIPSYVFNECYSLAYVAIPASVTSIDDHVFYYCYSLTSIVIPDSVTSIDGHAFMACNSLPSIIIPDSVTTIGQYAFGSCNSLSSIIIPEGVKTINTYTFYNCYSLASVTIPDSVTKIDHYAFDGCRALTSIIVPEGVPFINNYVFGYCHSLASIIVPESVTIISDHAFYSCYSLASVTIPDSVTAIDGSAFSQCYSLVSVSVPGSVTSIGGSAFYKCYSMRFCDFSSHTAVPTLSGTGAFNSTPADCEIRVPAALYDEWIAATNWSSYADKIVAV